MPCPYNIIFGRDTALPSPNFGSIKNQYSKETALPSPNFSSIKNQYSKELSETESHPEYSPFPS